MTVCIVTFTTAAGQSFFFSSANNLPSSNFSYFHPIAPDTAPQPRVEQVPERIPEHVYTVDRDSQGKTGPYCHPGSQLKNYLSNLASSFFLAFSADFAP